MILHYACIFALSVTTGLIGFGFGVDYGRKVEGELRREVEKQRIKSVLARWVGR